MSGRPSSNLRHATPSLTPGPDRLQALADFWLGAPDSAGAYRPRKVWFEKDAVFDAEVRRRHLADHEAAAAGAFDHLATAPLPALALTILLDQVPRNIFRGNARAYATDAKALATAEAAIAQGFDMAVLDPNGAERLHLEAEAARLAYRDRAQLIADPDAVDVPSELLLSPSYADGLRTHIDRGRAMAALPPAGETEHRDTVYLTVVDSERNAISFNSTFHSFGSGICAPKSGVMLQNRGASFVLDADHPNCIAPGKRPMHTIIPGMLSQGERAVMPFGVMGGHYQAVGHTHFLTNFIDYGMDPQEALDSPRAFYYEGALSLENGIGQATAAALAELGHPVAAADVPIGGGQAIHIDWQRGTLTGGSDPRKDGCALGY